MSAAIAASPPGAVLPPLRQDLRIVEGPSDENGQPTWTLIDAVRNRFFRIGWAEQAMLARWGGRPEEVAASVNAETVLSVEKEDIAELAGFLVRNELCAVIDSAGLRAAALRRRRHPLEWLLHNYLFFRIPLWHPDAFLARTLHFVRPLLDRRFLYLLLGLAGLSLYLLGRQWDAFAATFLHFFTPEGLFYYLLTLSLVKALHELGHAYAAKAMGLRVPSMGIAFMVMLPVLYTDTGEAWKLKRRRDRLFIGAAGVGVETALAVLASLAWSFLPDGIPRSIAFFTTTTGWTMSLLVNVSPFMRFDGYYLLSDAVGVANLQERAFALARWRLRHFLWGLEAPCPESLAPGLERFMTAYAYATWIYRFSLFLGIALFVYHQFFKLLGIFLLLVEVGWFIARPIIAEIKVWWTNRARIAGRGRAGITLSLLGLGLLLLVFPWKSRIEAPAILKPGRGVELFFPASGQIAALAAAEGREVVEGELLAELRRPDLEWEGLRLELRLEGIAHEIAQAHARPDKSNRLPVLLEQQENLAAQKTDIADQMAQMKLAAPFAGRIRDLDPALRAGNWVAKSGRLARLVEGGSPRIEAFLEEGELPRVRVGAAARFLPEAEGHAEIRLRVIEVEPAALSRLRDPVMASTGGGPLAARQMPGIDRPVPLQSLHRIILEPADGRIPPPLQTIRGRAMIEGERASLLARTWRHAMAVLLRESGF